MVKWYICSSSWEANLRTAERHLSSGITQCYLPLNTGERK